MWLPGARANHPQKEDSIFSVDSIDLGGRGDGYRAAGYYLAPPPAALILTAAVEAGETPGRDEGPDEAVAGSEDIRSLDRSARKKTITLALLVAMRTPLPSSQPEMMDNSFFSVVASPHWGLGMGVDVCPELSQQPLFP
ncbi:hypothetical protein H920_14401 [Fukomys damarensis]|uniref:Uncharacterized protein n=1 Tax=Fukomys damarensis TaxID=885580 RepID=A0A091DNA9_FUKDA|nr:hypothetical protein H920_14401 [Fukomys damarensis]